MAARTAPCIACHGERGRATAQGYFPRIAAKPAGYLHNQLRHFKRGRRHNRTMNELLSTLSDAYLRRIADYFSGLVLPYPRPQPFEGSPSTLVLGRTLAMRGDPSKDIARCTACHGRQLMGDGKTVPGLLGLSRDYLLAQFGAWRNGARQTREPDCMRQIAQRLNSAQMVALAGWLSSQPVPTGAALEAVSNTDAVPMQCASMER